MPDSIDTLHYVYATPPEPASFDAPEGFVENESLSAVIVDSIAGDTVSGRVPHFIPVDEADSLRAEAFAESMPAIEVLPPPSGIREGLAPTALAPGYVHSTPLVAIMIGILVALGLNASGIERALKSYKSELWSIRRRPNVFDDERTVRLPMAVLLALVFVIFGGIVLYNMPVVPPAPSFTGVLASMGLVGAYCLFQRTAYSLVGYTFATHDEKMRWLGGYDATQAFAGIGMVVPAMLMVFMPEWHAILLNLSVSIYGVLHLIFIVKGVRIFYHKIGSLLYFILYLCTLEIIPLLVLYRLSELLTEIA